MEILEGQEISTKIDCCFGCLCKKNELTLSSYKFQNEGLKKILQLDSLNLCFLCMRLAQRTEAFIQAVQSNQMLFVNFETILRPTFRKMNSQPHPIVNLICNDIETVDLGPESEIKALEKFSVTFQCPNNVKTEVKNELKEETEISTCLEGEFVNDFDDTFIKAENDDEDDFPLKELLKQALEVEKMPRKIKKKKTVSKVKKKKTEVIETETINPIETIVITLEDCLREREKMASETKYLDSPFKCEFCIKAFVIKDSYEKHMEKHNTESGEFECDICKLRTDSEEKLSSHRKYHFIRYRCGSCGLTRVGRVSVKEHFSAHHAPAPRAHVCLHCEKTFKREVSLKKHVLYKHRHRERVTCPVCKKSYATKEVLKTHMVERHNPDRNGVTKKFVCTECGMAFRAPSQLRNHAYKHATSRDYYCVECDKTFKSDQALKNHLKTAVPHIDCNDLPRPCLLCDKRFASRRDLERHTNRIHLKVKPYQCDKCEKAYINSWTLNEHKRYTHDGAKRPLTHACTVCSRVFDRKQILKCHMRTHTGERPYQCQTCPAKFSQTSALSTHVKLIHMKLTRDGRPKGILKY